MFGPASGFDAVGEGTLFINAVSKMPVQVQTRLLKRLDQDFDGRLIAACGNDLEGLIEQGSFNSELFYRLARIEIPIPPLGTRPEDAVWLLQQLFSQAGASPCTGVGRHRCALRRGRAQP